MIFGIGVDLIEIDRIKNACIKFSDQFYTRIFTAREQEFLKKKQNPYPHVAARFAVKEAVGKAFGTGLGEISWKDIEVLSNKQGKPEVNLLGKAKKVASLHNITEVHVSISHSKNAAVANVVLWQTQQFPNEAKENIEKA